jgi:hypothetical protein
MAFSYILWLCTRRFHQTYLERARLARLCSIVTSVIPGILVDIEAEFLRGCLHSSEHMPIHHKLTAWDGNVTVTGITFMSIPTILFVLVSFRLEGHADLDEYIGHRSIDPRHLRVEWRYEAAEGDWLRT